MSSVVLEQAGADEHHDGPVGLELLGDGLRIAVALGIVLGQIEIVRVRGKSSPEGNSIREYCAPLTLCRLLSTLILLGGLSAV